MSRSDAPLCIWTGPISRRDDPSAAAAGQCHTHPRGV